MRPERFSKPALTQERSKKLDGDGREMIHALEDRREWLLAEQHKQPLPERKEVIGREIQKIDDLFEWLKKEEENPTEDSMVRFLHEAALLLGEKSYSSTATIIPFRPDQK